MEEIAFVTAPRQNTFFTEIVAAVRDELSLLGVRSSVSTDGFPPPRRGLVYALVPPHEWFALHGRRHPPTARQLKRTIGLCAEQPGTAFFEDDVTLAAHLGAVLDVSPTAVRELARRGVPATHFPLGWTRSWSHVDWDADEARDVDVVHLGVHSGRRADVLARSARHLARWRCRLLLSDDHGPNFRAQPNYATGEAKWDLLRRSRVLLNVHVAERAYFEWQRVVQAACNGCLVVSEHASDHHPMQVGRHFLSGRPEVLGLLAGHVLEDEDRRRTMARAAWELLRAQLPLRRSVERLVAAAEAVDRAPPADGPLPPHVLRAPAADLDAKEEFPPIEQFPAGTTDPETSLARRAAKAVQLDLIGLRRELARQRAEARAGGDLPPRRVDHVSPGHAVAHPRVSVLTSLYDYERHVGEALTSCAAGRYDDLELIVVDDGSADGSRQAVREWSEAHPAVPLALVVHPYNRGLGAARNTALDFARGELSFVLDADNTLYRTGLEKLVSALDAAPGAAFAYGMLANVRGGESAGLRSYFPWRPERLRSGNYIDAMALWRTRALRGLGGFTGDLRLYGWEDYDMWCRAAEHGLDGVLVPDVVGRYRLTNHSMLSVADVSWTAAVSLLVDRYPRTLGGVAPPP